MRRFLLLAALLIIAPSWTQAQWPSTSTITSGHIGIDTAVPSACTKGQVFVDTTSSILRLCVTTGAPGTWATFALATNNLSFFASTSSAQLATLLSDETGSGLAVFGTGPTLGSPVLTGTPVIGDGAGNDKLSFVEEATNPTCATGDFFLWANSADLKLKKCQDGTTTDLDTAGAGGVPGGTGNEIQYRVDGTTFGGAGGTTWDNTNRKLTWTQGTLTTSHPFLNHTVTWNAGAITFTNIFSNVTNTASAGASMLIDLQLDSASKFKVDRSGTGTFANGVTASGNVQVNGPGYIWINDNAGKIDFGGSDDIGIKRESATALAVRNGPTDNAYLDLTSRRRLVGGTDLVTGDFVNSAGWGTSNSGAVDADSKDEAWRYTVTSGTASQTANPTVVFTFKAAYTIAPICGIWQQGGSGARADVDVSTTTTTATLTWLATPGTSLTYIFAGHCKGTVN